MKVIFNILLWCISKLTQGCARCRPVILLALSVVALTFIGCTSSSSYAEGQNLNLGILAPYDGQIYGANVVSFFSGCRVQVVSNQTFAISRIACSSNTYLWGAAQTNEKTDTSVVFDKRDEQ